MEKKNIIDKIIEKLEKEIEILDEAVGSIHHASVEAPGAMQSHSDTSKFQNKTSEENTILALNTKKQELTAIKNIPVTEKPTEARIGACVLVDDSGIEKRFIILPGGAGIEAWDSETFDCYTAITPDSPLGKALVGKREGSIAMAKIGSKEKKLSVEPGLLIGHSTK